MIQKSELVKILVKAIHGGLVDAKFQIYNKVLLDRALVSLREGEILLTEKGRQFLFQWECEQFLQALQDGTQPQDSDDVVSWLTKHQFLVNVAQSSPAWHISLRGRDWLSQLGKSAS